MPLFRLNQLPDFFSRACCLGEDDETVVDAMLGDEGRLTPLTGAVSFDARGKLNDVRELPKDVRRLVRLSNLRTPEGLRCAFGEDDWGPADAGEVGVRKLSVLSLFIAGIIGSASVFSFSEPGVGGHATDTLSGVAGWELSGPRASAGGGTILVGDSGGDSGGAGMSVPAVRE